MPLEEVPGAPRVTTDRARAPAAAAVPRAWDLEEAVVVEAVLVVEGVGVGKRLRSPKESHRSMDMKSIFAKASSLRLLRIAGTLAFLSVPGHLSAQQPSANAAPAS